MGGAGGMHCCAAEKATNGRDQLEERYTLATFDRERVFNLAAIQMVEVLHGRAELPTVADAEGDHWLLRLVWSKVLHLHL